MTDGVLEGATERKGVPLPSVALPCLLHWAPGTGSRWPGYVRTTLPAGFLFGPVDTMAPAPSFWGTPKLTSHPPQRRVCKVPAWPQPVLV